jgi:hypothetical protein
MDHILVETPVARFAYCKVPEEHAPEGLGAVSIDYLPPIPDTEVREAIGEIVSFVLGRRMMRVGSTTYDLSGWTVEEGSVNPWASNVRELCRRANAGLLAGDRSPHRQTREGRHESAPDCGLASPAPRAPTRHLRDPEPPRLVRHRQNSPPRSAALRSCAERTRSPSPWSP